MTIPKRRLEKIVPKKTTKNSRMSCKFKYTYKFEQFEIDLEKAIEDWSKHNDSEGVSALEVSHSGDMLIL